MQSSATEGLGAPIKASVVDVVSFEVWPECSETLKGLKVGDWLTISGGSGGYKDGRYRVTSIEQGPQSTRKVVYAERLMIAEM